VRLPLTHSIEHGVATFGTGVHAHRIAVLDVVAAEQSLSTADDDKQEEILAGCARFLNAQIDEFQLLVRAEPVDLARHVELIEERARDLGTELVAVAREYVAFLPALAQQRTLLDRRCHIVLLVAADATRRLSLPARLQRAIGRQKVEGGADSDADNDAARRLAGRSDEAARQLLRSGLRTRRMDDVLFAQLYHQCWSPDLARTQRLRRELRDFSTLVVGGARPALDIHSSKQDSAPIHGETNARSQARPAVDDQSLLALGGRTLADLVAPSGYDVRRDHLRIDDHYVRVLTLVAYPRTVTAGWMAPLVERELPVDVSIHVRPLPSAAMVRALSLQIAKLEASRRARIRGELVPDVERDVALEDAERLRDRLQRGEERIFSVAIYFLVRTTSRRELDDLTRRVETVLDGMLAQSRRTLWEQERGFRSCLPEGRDQCWSLATSTQARWLRRSLWWVPRYLWNGAFCTGSHLGRRRQSLSTYSMTRWTTRIS
jgi:hypothetical protein